jgi:predicted component of type VI protein secretion system
MLRERSFTLGKQADCDLVFDRARFAHISARHCEILYDPEGYQLRDHSREGTWVNDRPVIESVPLRPGDWIRLGPDGPLLRFLGQPLPAGSGQWAAGGGQWAVGSE